jgi:hypothetical protein
MENKTPLKSLQDKVDPVWEILIKHLDTLPRERYPLFSARKKCVEAMIEYASQFKSEAETLRKEKEELISGLHVLISIGLTQGGKALAESLISKYDKK